MRKRTVIISLVSISIMVVLFYAFVFQFVVPRAASISIPYAWRNIPLKQDTATVHAYLGEPTISKTNQVISESWEKGIRDQKYQLTIEFSPTTGLATHYQIGYHFKKWMIQKEYVLEQHDLRPSSLE